MFDLEIYEIINILGLGLGMLFGMIAQKNQFCFSGSIKDYILLKSTRRGASVVFAMIVAIISTKIVGSYFDLDFTKTVYYKQDINYFIVIFGGLLFGTGMMIADGCSNRHLIKFGQGDSKSLITLIFIGIFGFATAKGLIQGFLTPFTQNKTLLELSSMIENSTMNIYVVVGVLFVILLVLAKKVKRIFTLIDGFLIGLIIAAAWTITGVLGEDSMERLIDLSGISFVYPTSKSLELFMFYQVNYFTFPIALLCGVMLGSFVMSFFNKKYSFGCTATQKVNRVTYNMIGGALMGVGGILSIGCTIGQGLTGMSTLAFASFLAIASIFISGTITGLILNKSGKLPMCFIFEWNDTPPDYNI